MLMLIYNIEADLICQFLVDSVIYLDILSHCIV